MRPILLNPEELKSIMVGRDSENSAPSDCEVAAEFAKLRSPSDLGTSKMRWVLTFVFMFAESPSHCGTIVLYLN